MPSKPVSLHDFRRKKEAGEPITVLTAYDALVARLLDDAGVDLILVGDSLANVFQGKDTTLPVTLDEMIYHGEIVARSVKRAFVAVDMPFLTYQVSPDEAVRNAGRLLKETGCRAVKLEGGRRTAGTISRLVESGIPVIGHVGLTPQSVLAFGGFGVQGRANRDEVLADARAVEDAGAFAIVLEKMPRSLAAEITAACSIPTIGIGAGAGCDGQVLVTTDLLGFDPSFRPRFARRYCDGAAIISDAVRAYCEDVRARRFPTDGESYE